MTTLEALEEVQTAGINTILYADPFEANYLTDKLLTAEMPVLLIMPIKITDNISKTGALKSTFPFEAMLLTKDPTQATTDYAARDIENRLIAPMRLLARKYMHKLNEHEIIDPEGAGITAIEYTPVYSENDANLFGVRINANVPVMEKPVVC
jgi:hypothetical protein